jgi:class 3 adenylate cyclase
VGHVINLASRMHSAAPPDGVVVSEETRRLVEESRISVSRLVMA